MTSSNWIIKSARLSLVEQKFHFSDGALFLYLYNSILNKVHNYTIIYLCDYVFWTKFNYTI